MGVRLIIEGSWGCDKGHAGRSCWWGRNYLMEGDGDAGGC